MTYVGWDGREYEEAEQPEEGAGMTGAEARERLEYLRSQIRAESISYGEIAELQGLTDYIEPGDVELLEWAGVPEFGPEREAQAEAYRRTAE